MYKPVSILILSLTLFILSCGFEQNINTSNSAMAGSQAAPTEIIIFSDFQCPHCKRAAKTVRRMVKTHPNRYKVYYKHFPLSYHQFAFRAACASEAARLQGKFWKMHNLLFAYSDELSEDTFFELAGKLNLNIEKFSKDINSSSVSEKVNADIAEGDRLKISGTPYIFVNRQPYLGSLADLQSEFN